MIREMPEWEKPREKLLREGREVLSNSEILALIIRTGTKERSALQPICDKYSEYLSVIMQIKETRELLSDPLLNDEAEADLGKLTIRKEKLTEELRILLIPPDPMDSRNVILEIRAGVGGDEAALFCGDLVRMYQKYADKNELSTRLLSLSTSAVSPARRNGI